MLFARCHRYLAAIAVCAGLLAGQAQAQDSVFDWEGLYIGGILGVAWSEFDVTTTTSAGSSNATSVAGGGFSGFNVLLSETVLAGVESDIVFSDLAGNLSFGRHRASLVGRLGVLATPSTLIYGLAGVASGQFKAEVRTEGTTTTTVTVVEVNEEEFEEIVTTTTAPGQRGESTKRLWGFTVGGGIEKEINAFAFPMRFGTEYRYSNFSDWDLILLGDPLNIDTEYHEVRFRFVVPLN